MDYALHLGILIAISALLATSLDLLLGHAGLPSMAQAAFFGLGAYASAIVSGQGEGSRLLGVGVGITLAALSAYGLSWATARLRDDAFVLATLAFQMLVSGVLTNWIGLTRGPLGIADIPPLGLFGRDLDNRFEMLALVFAVALAVHLYLGGLTAAPFGRILRAIREDESWVRALGHDPRHFRTRAAIVSAAVAALAGSLYAHYVGYIDPSSFSVLESTFVLSMVALGGAASPWGPAIGAGALTLLPELLRFVGLSGPAAMQVRQLLFGVLLTLAMILRPNGLFGRYQVGR